MRQVDYKRSWLGAAGRSSGGFMKDCDYCGRPIYLARFSTGKCVPYESWVAGNVSPGEWVMHECSGYAPRPSSLNRRRSGVLDRSW